jgi:uncharacterized LabA/DUF88 family protein
MKALHIYIDGNNLHRSAKALGFDIDYKKFGVWLRQKYAPAKVYIFIGYIPDKYKLYEHLERCGFVLIFKKTAVLGGSVKGNCDAELVLKAVSDFYMRAYDSCILVSGDGDFGCLVEFLVKNNALYCIIVPDMKCSSFFLRSQNVDIFFLNKHYYKFSA